MPGRSFFTPPKGEKQHFSLIPPALGRAAHSAPRAHHCVNTPLGVPSARAAWGSRRELRVAHIGARPCLFGQPRRDRLRAAQPPMALPPAPKRNAVGVLDDVSSAPAKRSKAQGPTAPAQGANDPQKERQQFEPATPSWEDARALLWDCVDHYSPPEQLKDIGTAEGLERLGVALEGTSAMTQARAPIRWTRSSAT